MEDREKQQAELHEKWKQRTKYGGLYDLEVQEFVYDLRHFSGEDMYACQQAGRIESYDFNLSVERLKGNRPPEWQLKIDALEERIKRIEAYLTI